MKQRTSRIEKIARQIKRNPIVALLLFLGTVVIALSSFTEAAKKLISVIVGQPPEAARTALGGMSLTYTSEDFVAYAAFQRKRQRPVLTTLDRLFWVGLSRAWRGWRGPLHYVQPDTVVRWQRERFRRFWARLS